MKGNTKVIFLGYGKVGYACLSNLIQAGIDVIGVVPRDSDHGEKSDKSSVRALALELNISIFGHNEAIKFKSDSYLKEIDYLISVQYDKILKLDWLSIPKLDCLNLHFSFLPRLRGCFPTKWAIIEENFSGVTLHSIDQGIDTGPILSQKKVFLDQKETDQSLYEKLSECAVELFYDNIPHIKNKAFPYRIKQIDSESSYHPKSLPYEGVLELAKGVEFCDRFLRAFDFKPFPPAFCCLEQFKFEKVGFYSPCHFAKSEEAKLGYSQFTKNNLLKVHCSDGILFFDQVFFNEHMLPVKQLKKVLGIIQPNKL